ncbi:EexN family lipoprotein [Vibrio parahaemolyticus]|uniref:EexN family lipoprotein n=1 Tax=Vibrio parahaemolyticus TaxID=670 RepID=UPI000416E7AA|nr:EexN family lipoprotein [Vibrio parahaemolyticus]
MLAVVAFSLTGCFESEKTTGPVQTVEWFKSHNDERKETLKTCANNPGELSETPNCVNALEAENQLSSGSLKNVNNW